MTQSSLLAPKGIAIVGASADEARPGWRAVAALRKLGYAGEVYPVSSKAQEIAGYPTVASLDAVPGSVDLAIIMVRAQAVGSVLRDVAAAGIRSAVVLSSGFGETGEDGALLEEELRSIALENGMDVLGPNCLGFVDLRRSVAATFSTALELARDAVGDVTLVSQSGAMGAAIFGVAQVERLPVSSFVSTGNEAVLSFADIVDRLVQSGPPQAVLGYIEGTADGRDLVRALREARAAGTKVAILKVGTTEAGQRAAQSHTGALSGSDRVWDAALRRAGTARAANPSELLELSMAYSVPHPPAGRRVAILSMSGGAGVMMSDRAQQLGLDTPAPGATTRERLSEQLPGFSALANPIDFGGVYTDPSALISLVETVIDDPGFDAVALFVGLTPGLLGTFESELGRITRMAGKPVVVSWFGGPREGVVALRGLGIPTTTDPVRAMEVLAAMASAAAPLPDDPHLDGAAESVPLLDTWRLGPGRHVLSEETSKRLVASYGIESMREFAVRSAAEADAAALKLGGRVVVKVDAPGLVHKSDIGGVILDVEPVNAGAVYRSVVAAAERAGAAPAGAIVAEQAPRERIELLVGTRWDQQFGPVVLVGAGGTASELQNDTCLDLAPVTAERAREMILSLRCAPLFRGFRGGPCFDLDAAARAVADASVLAATLGPELEELDINPLAVFAAGCRALDAVAIVTRREGKTA